MLFLSTFLACNQYEYFNIAGYEQADFSNKADILFVIDNSSSMRDEAVALGENFSTFINILTSEEGATESTENLDDAVDAFVSSVTERGKYIDYQLAITTTSVDYTNQPTSGIDPGEAGLLLGEPPVIDKYDPTVNTTFRKNLFCEATYWERNSLPSGEGYVCGDDTDEISQAYLDCLCDNTDWDGRAGSGNEEPLEAALLAMCRAAPEPPEICNEPISPYPGSEDLTNDGLLRENSTAVIVIVGDEGDNSRRMQQGMEDPSPYLDAFAQFDRRVRIVTIGPNYDEATGDFSCNSGGARTWMVERLRAASEETQGFFRPLEVKDSEGNCQIADFSGHLEDLGALLNSLETSFQLRSVPDVTTIQVYVDGEEAPASPILNAEEYELNPDEVTPNYGDGWSYSSAENAVVFWGTAIPDYESDVRIYYRPIGGTPRELPFSY